MTDVVAQLHRRGGNGDEVPTAIESAIAEWGTRLGVLVRPLHPGTTDPELAGWFHVVVPPEHDADAVVARLLADANVAAAYVKPPDAAP